MSCIVFSFKFAFTILFSAVGVTNFFLTKNRVADLQESLFKGIHMTFLFALRSESHSEYSTETGAPDGEHCLKPTLGEKF